MPLPSAAPAGAESTPSKLAWIGDDGRFWRVCTVLFGAFAVCKGLRMPSTWALTQAQIDYSHGLIKRGLLGSMYGAMGLHHRVPLSVVFFVELAVFFGLLAVLAKRCGLAERMGSPAVLTVFAGSYAVTYMTHLVGYSDIPSAVLAMGLLLIRRPVVRFWTALVVVPVAMLVHESFLLLFLPVVLFSFYVDGVMEPVGARRRRLWMAAGLLAGVALVFAFLLSLRPNLTPLAVAQLGGEIAGRVDFPVNGQVLQTLRVSLVQNVHSVLVVMKQEQWWSKFLASLCALVPLVLLAMRWLRRLVSALEPESGGVGRPRLLTVALASCFAPLLIYGLGWDCARWNVLCVLSTFLTLLLLSRRLPGRVLPMGRFDRNAIILVLAINLAAGFGFFDGFQSHPYPFFPALMETRR